jgi:hypothetical protein
MLIGHATSSCVDDQTPLQQFEVTYGIGLTRLRNRKGPTRLLNTVTHSFADNTWSVLTEFVSWTEKKGAVAQGIAGGDFVTIKPKIIDFCGPSAKFGTSIDSDFQPTCNNTDRRQI